MPQNKKSFSRIKILNRVVVFALAVILVRLFFIQIIEHDAWVAKADEKHTLLEEIPARRGEIYMMDQGEPTPVVLNQTVYQIIIDPAVTEKTAIFDALSSYAKDYITADLEKIYGTEGLRYAIVAKNVPREIAEKIAEEGIGAVWFQKTNRRVYPEGEMASGLLGFVNLDGVGQYGVEGSLNELLSGKNGLLKTTSDINNVALSIGNDNIKIPAEDGKDVVLSIDRGLEKGTEEIMAEHLNSSVATNASVIIMKPQTGEVIAMSSLPNYDPGNYAYVEDASIYLNYTTDVPYEPASICKTFAFSAALEEGAMTPWTTYFNEHYTVVDDWKIWNAETRSSLYGTIDMRTALYWSLNTGSIQALRLLGGNPNSITQQGREKLYDYYYNKFRLGRPTGIEISEATGFIPDPNEGWGRDSTYANMTFGQNLSLTMIQTATAFSAVVNGGYWRTPSVVKYVTSAGDGDGRGPQNVLRSKNFGEGESPAGPAESKILSDETSATMREMLIHNRDYKARYGIDRSGYDIGGKSGTAQVVKNGAYDDTMSELVGGYAGFIAPTGALPEYVILTKMWGEGQAVGSGDAMSLFDDLSNFVINYTKLKPGV
ncbi:penicillin-binding protein 2 [Candidatus Saccharibacteria bacterium]|nr:penicillin-binding protein 2 [Candidatus Saccharibacteria bacterium]